MEISVVLPRDATPEVVRETVVGATVLYRACERQPDLWARYVALNDGGRVAVLQHIAQRVAA